MIVKFKGGRQLEAALRELGDKGASRRTAERALDRSAIPIREAWVAKVDVVKGVLRRSIKIGPRAQTRATRRFKRGSGQDIVERFIGIDPTESPVRLPIYSVIEEFGDENQPANPAGRQAWEEKKMEAFNRLKDDLWDEISKTAARQARKRAKG